MAKKKKSKDPWVRFVESLFTRNRAKRPYTIPKEYIMSVADNLWRANPTKEIIINVLTEFGTVMYEKGFQRKTNDIAWWKEKQEHHLKEKFDKFKDSLDDLIHEKSNINQ
jgi:hypothetical protein